MSGFDAQAQLLSQEQLNRQVSLELQKILADDGNGLTVSNVLYRYDLQVNDGEVSVEVDLPMEIQTPGRHTILVNVLVDGVVEKVLEPTAKLTQRLRIPVPATTLERGTVVSSADFNWIEKEFSRSIPGLVTEINAVVGKALTRTAREGRLLQSKWFEAPVAVDRGERIRVKVSTGLLTINTLGVAMGKGRIGETIEVRNPDSRQRYLARIIGPGEVQVEN
ncbi:MAG: flagellar basal body P-ring formation protein FlgA [Magnetococcales bacterium]|nr:flagellar basal body P-ring formation protein FlgA [Magnetococcales bacterium]